MATNTYGVLDTGYFTTNGWQGNWSGQPRKAPTVDALAIALAMPSVEPSGARAKRGGLKSPGFGSYYMAMCLGWQADVSTGCTDLVFATVTQQATPSSKQNNLTGLVNAGLIQRYRVNGTWHVALTDAGVAQCKAVNAELGKAAKAFTVAARDKAVKAAAKAAKPASKPRKPAKVATPVDVPADVDATDARIYAELADIQQVPNPE